MWFTVRNVVESSEDTLHGDAIFLSFVEIEIVLQQAFVGRLSYIFGGFFRSIVVFSSFQLSFQLSKRVFQLIVLYNTDNGTTQ